MSIDSPPQELVVETPRRLPDNLSKEKLVEIGAFILDGLSEDEACILAGFSPKVFKEIKQSNEALANYMQKKLIEFKRKHLKTINAKSGDKNSMWMLEHILPEQFGAKRKEGNTTVNVIGAIIKDIRQSNELPVKIHEGTATDKGAQKALDPMSVLR